MEIGITVDSDQAEVDLHSLQQWLLQDPGLRHVRFTCPAPVPRPGDMGAVSELLLATLGGGGAGAVLANSVSVWLQSRVTQVKVRVEGSQGSVEVEAGNVKDPVALIMRVLDEQARLNGELNGEPSPGDGRDDGADSHGAR
ncbi:hypothetical protein ACFXA3_03715 [Streptomyces sp. NPDC059456]|uniref:effector-associated constant component EACC1 n=1 Tax=Streptomyces sp. NPDC059456 TaxID=3346838 RepID=UPI00369D5031